jgi:hypothetical protein
VDAALARELREFRSPTDGETRMFYEIVIAPGYTPEGLEVLKGKSKTVSGGRDMCGWVMGGADRTRWSKKKRYDINHTGVPGVAHERAQALRLCGPGQAWVLGRRWAGLGARRGRARPATKARSAAGRTAL